MLRNIIINVNIKMSSADDESLFLNIENSCRLEKKIKELKEEINGEWATNIVALATINTKETDDGVKEFQNIYNKAFLPPYSIKAFRLLDYNSAGTISGLRQKSSKDLKPHERFVLNVTGEYGCKDFYILKELKEYNPEDNLVSTNEPMSTDGDDY